MTAKENFLNGYNCAQAVLCAFSQEIGLPSAQLKQMACGLGGGISGMREVCGAVNGMVLAADLIKGKAELTPSEKSEYYAFVRNMCTQFQNEVGSIRCAELLKGIKDPSPSARTAEYYKKRPCADLCALAEKVLRSKLGENIFKK